METRKIVREYYDSDVEAEWMRLERHPFEFEINRRFMQRYIKPGDSILDLGGGPGRYSLFLAGMGCRVTLADLSPANVAFAAQKAREHGLELEALACDALDLSALKGREFNHVLCMGPLYHLLEAREREKCVQNCLELLKPGGCLFAAFISNTAAVIYAMKYDLDRFFEMLTPRYLDAAVNDRTYTGEAFTHACFASRADARGLMESFPLKKLHFLGSESILAPCEPALAATSGEIRGAWLDLAEKLCEREEFLSFAEHYLYIGKKEV